MTGGIGLSVEDAPKAASVPHCDRCGAAAVVSRGDRFLCGPCYYAQSVHDRTSERPGIGSSDALAVIEEIERAVMHRLRRQSCNCDSDER